MGATLKINLTQGTQDIANNRTYVSGNVQVVATGSTYNQTTGSSQPTGSLSGTFSGTWAKGFAKGKPTTLYSFAGWVTHDDEGNAIVDVSASYNTRVSPGTISATASLSLTQIPRVSDITVDKTSVTADGLEQLVATVTKKSDSFTDILAVSIGEYSKEVVSGVAFTIPKEWCNAIPGTSGKANVTVTTKSGETVIGANSVEVDVFVPEDIVPTINSISITEAVSKVTDAFGDRFVQELTQLNVVIDAVGAYGSTVNRYSTRLDGVTYVQQAFTSNLLMGSGALQVDVMITDSRGRTASATKTIEVVEYRKPVITDLRYMHCNVEGKPESGGKYTKVTVSARAFPVDGSNIKSLMIRYKSVIDELHTTRIVDISELDWEFTAEVIIPDTNPVITHEYIAEFSDKLHGDTARTSTGVPVLSRKAGGTGITMFEEALEDGFVVGRGMPTTLNDLTIRGVVNFAHAAETLANLGLINYPVEEGVSEDGVWSYRKWNSGKAECWGRKRVVNEPITTADNWNFCSAVISLGDFPFPFIGKPCVHLDWNGDNVDAWTSSANGVTTEHAGNTWLMRSTKASAASGIISIYVEGEWMTDGEVAEMTATHDDNGNVTVYGATAIHDGNGNVTIL